MPFDFMNQQLVFDEITNFVQFAAPYVKHLMGLRRIFSWLRRGERSLKEGAGGMSEESAESCIICGTSDLVMAHNGPCGHPACYVCIATELHKDPSYSCPRCNVPIT